MPKGPQGKAEKSPQGRRDAAPGDRYAGGGTPALHAILLRDAAAVCSASVQKCEEMPSLSSFLSVVLSEGGFSSVGHLDPLRVRGGLSVVVVVPVPPLVRRGLGITFWRVLPSFLTAERCNVAVAPGGPHRLVAAAVDEVCPEHALAVAEEHVVAVPFIDAEVRVEAVGDGVPGHLPAHTRLEARDVRLRCA